MEPDRDDDALLLAAADDPEAFARFYRVHVRGVIAYFRRRGGTPARLARPCRVARPHEEPGAMTDFIDVLEEQLVTAHGRRPRRVVLPWRAGAVLVAAVAAAAIVVALVLALASPEPHRAASPPAHRSQTTPSTSLHGVRLAVLNGTTRTGLARDAANELVANGYPGPNVVTNDTTNQSRQRSEVFYEPGHRGDAQGVAGCLHIGFGRVRPMDAHARALADRAQVAVFVGADRAK